MPLENGVLLNNRYRIVNTIASGGMGSIYRANDEILGIAVAVKENILSNEGYLRQFRREATILANLRHPNLPRVTDHFMIDEQGQYLVMDYIEGCDLRDLIFRLGTLPAEEVVRIGMVVCNALEYLHSRSPAIVHRDIKPGNIKITTTGQVVLVDFGLAKQADSEVTTVGAQALTPGYAPPEQYGGGTEPRSDLYALGATLYAALTGKTPEDGLNRAMGSVDLIPIRKLNPDISPTLAQVIEYVLAVQVNDRYQNAASFRMALLAAAPQVDPNQPVYLVREQPPTGEYTETPTTRPAEIATQAFEKTAQPKPSPVDPVNTLPISELHIIPEPQTPPLKKKTSFSPLTLGISSGMILLTMAAVFLLLPGLRSPFSTTPPPTSIAGMNTAQNLEAVPSAPLPLPTKTEAPTSTPYVAPSQTPLPLPSPTENSEAVAAVVEQVTQTSTPEIVATPLGGGSGGILFASDRSGSVQLWLIDSGGMDARQITNLPDGACQPDWSPDGTRLVFISPCAGKQEEYPGASLYLVNIDGTGLVPLATMPGGDFDPAWSPDGAQIAFTSLRDNGIPHIYLYQLEDQSTLRLSHIVNYERQPAWSPDGKKLAYQTTRLGEQQIWIMDANGDNAGEFSSLGGGFEWMPVWSPDGSVLVYSQGRSSHLVARQVGSQAAQEVIISDKIPPAEAASFSPDGWWLVFEVRQDTNHELFLILKNGANFTCLTNNPGADFHPAWRPGEAKK